MIGKDGTTIQYTSSEEAKNLSDNSESEPNANNQTPSINPVTAERIRLLRTHLNLKVNEFAELVGYSRPYVSLIERGKSQANKNFLERVSKATDVPVEWLMGVSGGENDEEILDDDAVLARAFQYTEEERKRIRVRNQAEVRHHNGINANDIERLTEEERDRHQEMMQARGKRLREIRKGHQHSMMQCSETVQLSVTTICNIEVGKREMTKGVAKKLENAYDVSSKWLLYGDELSKDWPCSEKMIGFLESHPEVRKYVWEKMMEEESSQE